MTKENISPDEIKQQRVRVYQKKKKYRTNRNKKEKSIIS